MTNIHDIYLSKFVSVPFLRKQKQELTKRSGRDESPWVVTHLYMEEMLGISLHSYPYFN
jgi:hypothetical protein